MLRRFEGLPGNVSILRVPAFGDPGGESEDTWETIIKNGIVPDSPINMGPDFTKQFWVHDPEGNRIEFMEYTSRSFQVLGHRRDGAQDFC